MEPSNVEQQMKNALDDSHLESDEDTEYQTSLAPSQSDRDNGSRPISVETVKRNSSPAEGSPRGWEQVNETVTTPSTPSTTSPLPSPAIAFPTAFVPSEATEFEAMAYHQSFLNDPTSSDDEPESESPILIATPVNLSVPPTRPNLISITPPFRSRSYRKDATGGGSVSTQSSTRNVRSGSVNNYSHPRVEKKHRRKTSSLSSLSSSYSSHDLSIPSKSFQRSIAASSWFETTTTEGKVALKPSLMSPDRVQIDRNATIKARTKRHRNTFVHGGSPVQTEGNEDMDFFHKRVSVSYPDVGTWSRNVNADEKHIYSSMTPQSDIPPVPPLTPSSIPVLSSPSRAGTPTAEKASISPRFYRQDNPHPETTPERNTTADSNIQSPHSNCDAGSGFVPAKSLRRQKLIYTKDRPQSVRSLRMGNGDENPYPPSSINTHSPTHPILNNPSRKSLPFPYQHIYHQIPGLASPPASPLDRPPSTHSMSISHDKGLSNLAHTHSTSNLSMYSLSYADSEKSGDYNNSAESPRTRPANHPKITRKKSMKYLRETKESMVGRVMGKNMMNFGLGSWKRKNSAGSSHSGMSTPTTPHEENMVRE